MKLPFSTEQFLSVFVSYNQAIWPLQLVFNLLAVLAIFLVIKKTKFSDLSIHLILAFFWLWMGVIYQWLYFAKINPAAIVFGSVFVMQGLLFLYLGFSKSRTVFRFETNLTGYTGALLLLYALIIYPIFSFASGHAYPAAPTFGLPCPTTIFTFGLLLWAVSVPWPILIIPFIWSVVGFSAALQLTIREDIGLLIAGLLGTVLIFVQKTGAKRHMR